MNLYIAKLHPFFSVTLKKIREVAGVEMSHDFPICKLPLVNVR